MEVFSSFIGEREEVLSIRKDTGEEEDDEED